MTWAAFMTLIIVGSAVHLGIQNRPRTRERVVEVILLWMLAVAGICGLIAFVSHWFYSDSTAQRIGWATGSPFQLEMAVTNLSYGVLGIMCIWFRGYFWLATGIGNAILFAGANVVHIREIIYAQNYSPDNYGFINAFEVVWPAAALVLLVMYVRALSPSATSAAA